MPIYEYRCERGHTFEVMQRMTDDPLATCERCGATVERVLHPVAVHFKGKGFHNTDYGTRKRQREMKEAAGSSSTDGSSSSTTDGSKSEGSGSKKGDGKGSGDAKSGSGAASAK